MTYELAKQLRDAGFPHVGDIIHTSHCFTHSSAIDKCVDRAYAPCLSELIEAIDLAIDKETRAHLSVFTLHYSLNYNNSTVSTWSAHAHGKEGFGSTPEEAVARLWLAVNKKIG